MNRYLQILTILTLLIITAPVSILAQLNTPYGKTLEKLADSVDDYQQGSDLEGYTDTRLTALETAADAAAESSEAADSGEVDSDATAAEKATKALTSTPYLMAKTLASTVGNDNPEKVDFDEVYEVIEDKYDDCEEKENLGTVCGAIVEGECVVYADMYEYYVPVQIIEVTNKPFKSDFLTKDDAEDLYEEALEEWEKDDFQNLIKEDLEDLQDRLTKQGIDMTVPSEYGEEIEVKNSVRKIIKSLKKMKQYGPTGGGKSRIDFHLFDAEWDNIIDNMDHWTDRIEYWNHTPNIFGRKDPFLSEGVEGLEIGYSRSASAKDYDDLAALTFNVLESESFFSGDDEDLIPSCIDQHQLMTTSNSFSLTHTPKDILPTDNLDKLKGVKGWSNNHYINPWSPCLPGQFGKKGPYTHYFDSQYPLQNMMTAIFRAARAGTIVGNQTISTEDGSTSDSTEGGKLPFNRFYPTVTEATLGGKRKPDKIQMVKTSGMTKLSLMAPYLSKDCKKPAEFWTLVNDFGPGTLLAGQKLAPVQQMVAVQWHYFRTCQSGIPCGENWRHAPPIVD